MEKTVSNISTDELRQAHLFLAQLVANGEVSYLPIFKRLDQELADLDKNQKMIDKAKAIASQKKPTLDSHSDF